MRNIILILFVFILAGCSTQSGENDLRGLEWLVGEWVDSEHNYYESWSMAENSLFGTGLTITEGDTLFSETLRITEKGGNLTYFAVIAEQNDGTEVPFRLATSDTAWVFMNAEHDFPNKIIYKHEQPDKLTITVENMDKSTGFILHLRRMK